jgi:hypothetical protein
LAEGPVDHRELVMAKGQKRSNREAKKPKQPKSEKKVRAATFAIPDRGAADGGRKNPRR